MTIRLIISKIIRVSSVVLERIHSKLLKFFYQLEFWISYSFFIIIRYLFFLFKRWTFWLFFVLEVLNALSDMLLFEIPFSRESSFVIAFVGVIIAINDVNKKGDFKTLKKENKKFIGHTFKVNKVSLSSDEKRFVSSSDRVAIIWDIKTGKPLQRLQCPTWVGSAYFIDEDQTVIGIGGKGLFFKWDVKSGGLQDEPKKLETSDSVAFAVSSDEKIMASAGKDGEIHLWSYPVLDLLHTFKMGEFEIRKILFLENDFDIVGCDVTGAVTKFSIHNEKESKLFCHPDREPIRYIAYCSLLNEIAFVDGSGQLFIMNLGNGKLINSKNGHKDMGLCCAFSTDGQYLATGGQDNLIIIWKKVKNKVHKLFYINGHSGPITSLVFESATNNLYSASRDRKIKYWKLNQLLLSK